MKTFFMLILMSFFIGNNFALADKHHHHKQEPDHSKDSKSRMSLNQGKKWEADTIMKKNMEAIHTQFHQAKELLDVKKINQKDYAELSRVISNSAEDIASNCKRTPKADETVHVILEELFSAAESLKDAKKTKHAMEQLSNAFKIYPKYFNHDLSK